MAKRRDAVQELLEIKTRSKENHRSSIYFQRVRALKGALKAGGHEIEVFRYFPIGMIACMEAYFRATYAELLDKGEPYASRADPLVKDLKIDWRAIRAIEGRTVSSGEVVSHSLSFSSLDDIVRVMTALLGSDFLTLLKTAQARHWMSLRDVGKERPQDVILNKPDETFRYITRTFELRHIFCHESALNVSVSREELEACMYHCELFLQATEELVWHTLDPNPPQSQAEMTQKAWEALNHANIDIETALRELREKLDERGFAILEEAQNAWSAFIEFDAKLASFLFEGGTMQPMVRYMALEDRVKHRTKQLHVLIKEWTIEDSSENNQTIAEI